MVYLGRLNGLDSILGRGCLKKRFVREKLGKDVHFAFDETTRVLAVCMSSMVRFAIRKVSKLLTFHFLAGTSILFFRREFLNTFRVVRSH
jgi:hypothetical protein